MPPWVPPEHKVLYKVLTRQHQSAEMSAPVLKKCGFMSSKGVVPSRLPRFQQRCRAVLRRGGDGKRDDEHRPMSGDDDDDSFDDIDWIDPSSLDHRSIDFDDEHDYWDPLLRLGDDAALLRERASREAVVCDHLEKRHPKIAEDCWDDVADKEQFARSLERAFGESSEHHAHAIERQKESRRIRREASYFDDEEDEDSLDEASFDSVINALKERHADVEDEQRAQATDSLDDSFEEEVDTPLIAEMHEDGHTWSPSEEIHRLDDEEDDTV